MEISELEHLSLGPGDADISIRSLPDARGEEGTASSCCWTHLEAREVVEVVWKLLMRRVLPKHVRKKRRLASKYLKEDVDRRQCTNAAGGKEKKRTFWK